MRYLLCVGLLLGAAASIQVSAAKFGYYFRKEAVPLRKPLYTLDVAKLSPQYELHPIQPEPLKDDIIEQLGTREFLQIRLVDRGEPEDSTVRLAHVFVSYYTGKPDQVPHVPDECIAASGGQQVSALDTAVTVPNVGAPGDQLPIRALEFEIMPQRSTSLLLSTARTERLTVMYFFHVNNLFRTTRNEVRVAQSNLFSRYAYYAKVEVFFTDHSGGRLASRDDSLAAIGPLMSALMPVLLSEHFADWQALQHSARPDVTGGSEPRS